MQYIDDCIKFIEDCVNKTLVLPDRVKFKLCNLQLNICIRFATIDKWYSHTKNDILVINSFGGMPYGQLSSCRYFYFKAS